MSSCLLEQGFFCLFCLLFFFLFFLILLCKYIKENRDVYQLAEGQN